MKQAQGTAKKAWYDMKDLLKENTLSAAEEAQKILHSTATRDLDAKDREAMQADATDADASGGAAPRFRACPLPATAVVRGGPPPWPPYPLASVSVQA